MKSTYWKENKLFLLV